MASDSSKEAASTQELAGTIYEISCFDQTFDLKGWIETDNIDHANIELILKKRNTDFYYAIPYEWSDSTYWRAVLDINTWELSKGTWDFYFRYGEKDIRIKLEEDVSTDIQLLHKQDTGSHKIWVYRTKKGALSLKSSAAFIQMDELAFSKDAENGWVTRLQGTCSDSILGNAEDKEQMVMVVKNRHTNQETMFPVTMDRQKQQTMIGADVNYRDLPGDLDTLKQTWDCYLAWTSHGESHLLRMTSTGDAPLKEESGLQVEDTPLYQYYFDVTAKYNIIIKRAELAIQNNVETITFQQEHLHVNGFTCLDAINPDTNQRMDRYLVVKRKKNQQLLRVALSNMSQTESDPYAFAASIPLKQLFQLGYDGKEVFDLFVQFQDNDNFYEKKLGSEQYTYYKDGFVTAATVKYKGYTRFYIAYTPNGNIKMETYPLSTPAYLYLKYRKKQDHKQHKNKEVWLIGERDNTAQDTGYHFFKYCREHYPDAEIYYVIDRNSNDYRNVQRLGNVVYSGTLKHARIASVATTFIGSHELDYILPVKGSDLANYRDGKRVFLQHGVLGRKNVEYHKYYYQHPFHLFCVSSQAEKEMVQDKLQYRPDEVRVTGLSRFDHLLQPHDVKDNILLIPTWRDWLNTEKAFRNAAYFRRYQSLLDNQELQQLLEANDLTLTFYPHYRMQPFVSEFKALATDRMDVIELGERNVQDLLMESSLMVTDYSSVSFDFNYMSKPVVFYHFDVDRFFKNGILRPVEETFLGDICSTEEQVVDAIRYYVNNGFQEKDDVKQNKHQVFSEVDQQNNERIFQAIHDLS